jgi:hypothetical protein
MATWWECDECECANNQAGCDVYYQFESQRCYCGEGAPCAQACAASACADMEWDMACEACAEMLDDTCYDAAVADCEADATCSAFIAASNASCQGLPDR